MYVKTKDLAGRTVFYLCIGEQGGGGGRGWKTVEYSVCLGETLNLSDTRWQELLRSSSVFRSVSLDDVLDVLERYVSTRGLSAETLDGLRAAVRGAKQRKSRRVTHSDRRSQEDERTKALRLLGLSPGSSDSEIESAFRKAARRHHPDVGGDPAKFRAIVDARNFLLGREPGVRDIA